MEKENCIIAETEQFARVAVENIENKLFNVLSTQEDCSLMLTGGSTAEMLYKHMAESEFKTRIPWDKVKIFFGDERCVPSDHPDSNFRLAYTTLLEHTSINPNQIYRMRAEYDDIHAAAKQYESILPICIDVLLLAIGEDGHIASLFPQSPVLKEQKQRVVAVTGPKAPKQRLTITPKVIADARHVIVIACGSHKAEAVKETLIGSFNPAGHPAQLALDGLWILDRAASVFLNL